MKLLKLQERGRDSFITISEARKDWSTKYFRRTSRRSRQILRESIMKSIPGKIWRSGSLPQIDSQKEYQMTRGCPFGTLGNEVTDGDELVRQDLSLIFEV